MVRLRNALAIVRGQLWLLPALMSVGAAALAYLVLAYGVAVQRLAGGSAWWLYSGDASTARDLLSGLLSGMVTMTSLVVSVTIVILTTAASQLGPRLITHFMADRQIQFVLGLFIATALYLVIVLRTLDDALGPEGIPHVAITLGSLLTIASLFALLFYVHRVASSVIADTLVERVWASLRQNIREIAWDESGVEGEPIPLDERACSRLALGRSGYIQVIDYGQLVDLASKLDAIFRLRVRAGHFMLATQAHVDVWNAGAAEDDLAAEIRKAFVIGATRTPAQDVEHGLRQLVEIALRSLSAGINDPFTAIAVIHRLGAAIEEILARPLPPRFLPDAAGKVRVIADRSDLEGVVGAAFNQIRQAGAAQPAIMISLAQTLGGLAAAGRSDSARRALAGQLTRLRQTVADQNFTAADAADVEAAIEAADAAFDAQPAAGLND